MEPPNRLDFVRLAEEMFQQEQLKYNNWVRAQEVLPVEEELTVSESIDELLDLVEEEEVDELEVDELDFKEEDEVAKTPSTFSNAFSKGSGNVEF